MWFSGEAWMVAKLLLILVLFLYSRIFFTLIPIFFLLLKYDWFHLSMFILLVTCYFFAYDVLLSYLILLGGSETTVKLIFPYNIINRNSWLTCLRFRDNHNIIISHDVVWGIILNEKKDKYIEAGEEKDTIWNKHY